MLKKVVPVVLSLCLMLGIGAMAENTADVPAQGQIGNVQEAPSMPQGDFDPSKMPQGEMPQGDFDPSKMPQGGMPQGDFDPSKMPQGGMPQGDFDPSKMPEGMQEFFRNMQNGNQNTEAEQEKGFVGFVKTNVTPITSVVLLVFAFIFVIFYKRKNY